MSPYFSSLYDAVELTEQNRPLLIGERANVNGSKQFREAITRNDYSAALAIATAQEQEGAALLDLSLAYVGRSEIADTEKFLPRLIQAAKSPLVFDSTDEQALEAALRLYPGRPLINSANLEKGEETFLRLGSLAAEYGAALVVLTIDEQGMAGTWQRKMEIAIRMRRLLRQQCRLNDCDIVFDPLTFTLGSGDESLYQAGMETIQAIREICRLFPECGIILGVSNISFGLPKAGRKLLNSFFLRHAIDAGLHLAIVDSAKIASLADFAAEEIDLARELLFNREKTAEPLTRFIDYFRQKKGEPQQKQLAGDILRPAPAEEKIFSALRSGDSSQLEPILATLSERYKPVEIINQLLLPAMKSVGELFNRGELYLPFVLQSAQTMQKAVSILEPYMEKSSRQYQATMLLATVSGDVHDIGKNLVSIIVGNNGYRIIDLGVKVSAADIIDKIRKERVDAIGLSGLLVKSAMVMIDFLKELQRQQIKIPVFLGGAALSERFVSQQCLPHYGGQVLYCRDAFAGLNGMNRIAAGTLQSTPSDIGEDKMPDASEASDITGGNFTYERVTIEPPPPVEPPFWGCRLRNFADSYALFNRLSLPYLYRARWQFRRGGKSESEYEKFIKNEVDPLYHSLRRQIIDDRVLQARALYGYYRAWRDLQGEKIVVADDNDNELEFFFPRQKTTPYQALPDFLRTKEQGAEVFPCMIVTLGDRITDYLADLQQNGEYQKYFLAQQLCAALADTAADLTHEQMAADLRLSPNRLGAGGCRYSFGYSSCPDLEQQRLLFRLLDNRQIGVELSENYQMLPELSVSAFILRHDQSHYFTV